MANENIEKQKVKEITDKQKEQAKPQEQYGISQLANAIW